MKKLEVGDCLFRLRHLSGIEAFKIDSVSEQLAFAGDFKFVRANVDVITRVTDEHGYRKEFGESFELMTVENRDKYYRDIQLRFIRNFDYHLLSEEELNEIAALITKFKNH